jgi:hypothetical protein
MLYDTQVKLHQYSLNLQLAIESVGRTSHSSNVFRGDVELKSRRADNRTFD